MRNLIGALGMSLSLAAAARAEEPKSTTVTEEHQSTTVTPAPSTSTGSPRTKQNAAVAHVKTWPPVLSTICASVLNSPINATGPRVSANSNPK